VERARADRGKGKPGVLTTAEREELSRLRKENRELRTERDILKSRGLLRSTTMSDHDQPIAGSLRVGSIRS
jgi:transposase-like protein